MKKIKISLDTLTLDGFEAVFHDYLTFLTFFKPLDPDPDSESESVRPLNPDPIWIRIRNKFKVPEDCYAWINQIFIYC